MHYEDNGTPICFGFTVRNLVDFDVDHPNSNEKELLEWRDTIWNFAVYRSLEIWKKLPMDKIENSLGTLTKFGQNSLKGKLGSANNKFFKKANNGNWEYITFKQTSHQKEFSPFTNEAIEFCKKRARAR